MTGCTRSCFRPRRILFALSAAVTLAACGSPRGGPGSDRDGERRDDPPEADGNNVFSETVDPEEGEVYAAGTAIHVPEIGVGFVIPAAWRGELVDDVFVMEHDDGEAALLAAAIEGGTVAEARAEMESTIDLGDGIFFVPEDDVDVDGVVLTGTYSVSGAGTASRGYAVAIVGGYGWSVAMIGLATPAGEQDLRDGADEAAASVSFKDPEITEGVDDEAASDWEAALSGQLLHRFYSGSGYSEHEQMWLCADGRAARSFESGGVAPNFSTAFGSDYAGEWMVTGDESSPTLELHYNDGTYSSWALSTVDDKLYLDDDRWYREPTSCD